MTYFSLAPEFLLRTSWYSSRNSSYWCYFALKSNKIFFPTFVWWKKFWCLANVWRTSNFIWNGNLSFQATISSYIPCCYWISFYFIIMEFCFLFLELIISIPSIAITLTWLETQPSQEKQQWSCGQWPQPQVKSLPRSHILFSYSSFFLPSLLPSLLSFLSSFLSSLFLALCLLAFSASFLSLPTALIFPSQEWHMSPRGAPAESYLCSKS